MTFDAVSERALLEQQMGEIAYAYMPVRVDCTANGCGYDTFTQSGKNIQCKTCDGSGKVDTYRKSGLRCLVTWLDPAAFRTIAGGTVSSAEMGDCLMQGRVDDKAIYDKVQETDGAYILVNGDSKVKPRSVTRNRVHGYSSLEVRCVIVRIPNA